MNHRPRQPGETPSQHGAHQGQNQTPPVQHPPQHPGFNGYRPPQNPQQGVPVQNGAGGPALNNGQAPHNGVNGAAHVNGMQPPPQQAFPQSRVLDTGFGLPQHPKKPIPASVPSVDPDAISQALNQCVTEMDALERTGQLAPGHPDRLDDLVEIDMYTPKEQIPAAKRHIAAQKVAFRGPAEEGQGQKEIDLINALRMPAQPPAQLHENTPNTLMPPEQSGGELVEQLPPQPTARQQIKASAPAVTDRMLEAFEAAIFDEPEQKTAPTPQQPESTPSPPPPELFEQAPAAMDSITNTVEPTEIPDAFGSRLMPENNAYKVEREESAAGLEDTGMTIDDLHSFYAEQKAEKSQRELEAERAFLSQSNESSSSASGFLQGMGSNPNPAQPTRQFNQDPSHLLQGQQGGQPPMQEQNPFSNQLPLPDNLATSGGFLAGLTPGGSDQRSAISSRSIFPEDEAPRSGGSSFLDSLSSMKPPQDDTPLPGAPLHHQPTVPAPTLQPQPETQGLNPDLGGNDEIWRSNMISPAAKAYRDSVLFGDSYEQPKPAPMQPEPNPIMQQPLFQEPAQNLAPPQATFAPPVVQTPPQQNVHHAQPAPQPAPQAAPPQQQARPSFLDKPSPLATIIDDTETDSQAPPSARKVKKPKKEKPNVAERKKRRAIKNYFGDKPVWSILTAFIGLGLMASQFRYDPLREWVKPELTWYLVAGGAVFLLSILWRYFRFRKPPEDKLDDWIAEDLVGLEKRALDQLQLNNRYLLLEPVIMASFPDMDNIDKEHVYGFYGRDHILRYTPRAIVVMCFTRDEVLTYEGALDLTTGEIVYETTREFFYADVATVGMVKSKVKSRVRWKNIIRPWRWSIIERSIRLVSGQSIDKAASRTKESFIINLKSGSQIQLILRDGRILRDRAYEEVPLSTDEKVLKAISDFIVAQKTEQMTTFR